MGDQRMKSDREDQIRIQREDVNQAKRDATAAEQHIRQLTNALEKAKQEIVRFKRRQTELTAEHQQAEDAVEVQRAEIERNQPQDGKLQELERQLAEAQEELDQSKNNFIDMDNEKHRLGEIAKEVKAGMEAAHAELEQGKKNVSRAERRLDQANKARYDALLQKNEALEAIDYAKRQQQSIETELEGARTHVAEFVRMAEEICRRVPVDKDITAEVLDNRIVKLAQDKKKAEREIGGTRDELMLAYQTARREHADAKVQMKGMNTVADVSLPSLSMKYTLADVVLQYLKRTLGNRQQRWALFRKLITSRARSHFAYLLSERQFRGRLLMSHQDKELDIKIEPDLSKASDAGRAAKTLSGGEKSFSTICLLLSVWEAIGSPIRCLDEFDVFMDSVNRATSMSMMIQAARRAVGKQFILITPQSMQNVDLGDDVKVHKMSDPERGQTTLPY
jgi:chromosome segregation ATPase